MELPPLATELLEGTNFAAVSTLMADGSPYTTIVWIHTDGEHALFNCATARAETTESAKVEYT